MLGPFRVLLAWSVMLSHWPGLHFASGFNLGVSAVTIFYFISGYLMYHSFLRIQNARAFLWSRFLRIYPLYWSVTLATALLLLIGGRVDALPLLDDRIGWGKILLNLTLFADNYVFAPLQIPSMLPHPLVPPAWSLATELHFYLLVPGLFFLLGRKRLYFALLLLGSLFFGMGAWSSHGAVFNADIFGYRYLPGVLWIFLYGFLHASGQMPRLRQSIPWLLVGYYMLGIPAFGATEPFAREILLGTLLAPVAPVLMRLPFDRILDRRWGMLSYPLFLSHFLAFYISDRWLGGISLLGVLGSLALILPPLLWLQLRIERYRHERLRRRA